MNHTVAKDVATELDVAIELLRRGLWPVCLHPGEKRPIGKDWGVKRPDEGRLDLMHALHPGAGVGLLLGPDGGVIDAEIDGPEGAESLTKLLGGEVVPTMGWSSRRGPHRLFRWDDRLAAMANDSGVIKREDLPGLELRVGGPGKQIQSACPPTSTDGHAREWNGVDTIASLPEQTFKFLGSTVRDHEKNHKSNHKKSNHKRKMIVGDFFPDKPADPIAAWFSQALRGEIERVAGSLEGSRHRQLLASARTLGGMLHFGHFTRAEVEKALAEAADQSGLPSKEAADTIRDGLANGVSLPLPWPRNLDGGKPGPVIQHGTNGFRGTSGFANTDIGNAERFASRHGTDMRYCHVQRKFYVWSGRHWELDSRGESHRRAKDTVRAIYHEAANEPDPDARKAIVAWARRSESSRAVEAMLSLAKSEPPLPVRAGEWDKDPWKLNVFNGTIDLRSGDLTPHERADMITTLSPVAYDDTAKAPTWVAFLDATFSSDHVMTAFVQRLAGSWLAGENREQILAVFHGVGANGKSTLLNTILYVLGEHGHKAPSNFLTQAKADRHPTELASLFGKRLVVAVETGEGARLDEVRIKELTGDDPITARRMREDFWTFTPTHKVVLCTNHKPEVRGTDHAIWRRVLLVPFAVTVPDDQQDATLGKKLRDEASGVLAWLVSGCLEWRRIGLRPPASVTQATAEYRASQDVLGAFLADRCVQIQGARVKSGKLYGAYLEWCQASGESPRNLRQFGASLTERGIKRFTNNGTWYADLDLRQTGGTV